MSAALSPQQACDAVAKATGYHLDPKSLRTWRNRGLKLSFEQEGEGWTRYSLKDVFCMSVMAHAIRAGYTPRTSANVARIARDYAPGTAGSDAPGVFLVLPGITADDEDSEAQFLHRIRCNQSELHKIHEPDFLAKFGDAFVIVVPLSRIRQAVQQAVVEVEAS